MRAVGTALGLGVALLAGCKRECAPEPRFTLDANTDPALLRYAEGVFEEFRRATGLQCVAAIHVGTDVADGRSLDRVRDGLAIGIHPWTLESEPEWLQRDLCAAYHIDERPLRGADSSLFQDEHKPWYDFIHECKVFPRYPSYWPHAGACGLPATPEEEFLAREVFTFPGETQETVRFTSTSEVRHDWGPMWDAADTEDGLAMIERGPKKARQIREVRLDGTAIVTDVGVHDGLSRLAADADYFYMERTEYNVPNGRTLVRSPRTQPAAFELVGVIPILTGFDWASRPVISHGHYVIATEAIFSQEPGALAFLSLETMEMERFEVPGPEGADVFDVDHFVDPSDPDYLVVSAGYGRVEVSFSPTASVWYSGYLVTRFHVPTQTWGPRFDSPGGRALGVLHDGRLLTAPYHEGPREVLSSVDPRTGVLGFVEEVCDRRFWMVIGGQPVRMVTQGVAADWEIHQVE